MKARPRHVNWSWAAVLGISLICIPAVAANTALQAVEMVNSLMPLTITSPSFMHNRMIPARHTCDGANTSPQFTWSGLPPGTKSLTLIVDDPDAPDPEAPKMTWVHWVLYNIPPSSLGLKEGVAEKNLPAGTMLGINDWKKTAFSGPCPPFGKHRYFFKLYALDVVLKDLGRPTKPALEQAMQGHIVGHAELMGLYQRSN